MADSEVLAAEYRAFIKTLHPAAIQALVAVEGFWANRVYPFIPREDEDPLTNPEVTERILQFEREVKPQLMTLVCGHPDPDVRDASETLLRRMNAAIYYLDPDNLKLVADSKLEKVIADMVDSLQDLRRTLYHAPFRIERPEPRFNGDLIEDSAMLPTPARP